MAVSNRVFHTLIPARDYRMLAFFIHRLHRCLNLWQNYCQSMPHSVPQLPPQQLARCRTFSLCFALGAFCIGGAALLGWILNNEFLKRIHPSLVTMKANTSVCLMLVAVSVWLIRDRTPSTIRRTLTQVFAVLVALVGLITLSEHVFGWNTGLDRLLFHESTREAGQSFPGRMGVAASLNFFFLGIALLFVNERSRRWLHQANVAVLLVETVTLLVFL